MTIQSPVAPLPAPKTYTLKVGKKLIRFYDPALGPWDTGRPKGPMSDQRFDHHPPPYGLHSLETVWYAGASLRGAVAEAFGRPPGIVDRSSGRRIVVVEVTSPVKVIDLVGNGPRYLGLDQEVATTTTQYLTCQRWARELYLQFPHLAGIRWNGRQLGSENLVLTDHADFSGLSVLSDHDLGDPAVWPRIAAAARYCRLKPI